MSCDKSTIYLYLVSQVVICFPKLSMIEKQYSKFRNIFNISLINEEMSIENKINNT